jgi:hypothetical protein
LTDPIERAKRHAASMYPEAKVTTRSVKGRPIVLATSQARSDEARVIRLIRLTDLDADRAAGGS